MSDVLLLFSIRFAAGRRQRSGISFFINTHDGKRAAHERNTNTGRVAISPPVGRLGNGNTFLMIVSKQL